MWPFKKKVEYPVVSPKEQLDADLYEVLRKYPIEVQLESLTAVVKQLFPLWRVYRLHQPKVKK